MNITQHLLACLSEEAGEIVQSVGKAHRFGLDDCYPDTEHTSRKDLANEMDDLIAVYQILVELGELQPSSPVRVGAKKEKVLRMLKVSIDKGQTAV